MHKCAEIEKLLALRECGMLDDSGEATVSAHLDSCPSCAEYAHSIEAVGAAVRALDREAEAVEPPADLHKRLTAAVRKAAYRPARRLPAWQVAAIAAGLLIGFFSLYLALLVRQSAHSAKAVVISDDALPTLAVYRRAISLDPRDLDALLEKHARFCPRGEPVNTAGHAPGAGSAGILSTSKEAYHET